MKVRSLHLLIATLLLAACTDIIEKDLDGYGVVLVAPPDGHSTGSNVVALRWEAVPEADGYRLQVATPDFLNPVLFVYDSLTAYTEFQVALAPGTYRWRVRAENPNSHTDYYERSLIVTEASSLEGLTPILTLPGANSITRVEPLSFSWEPLTGADDYRFELREGSQSGMLVQAQIVEGTELELAGVSEGAYTWGIQAQNATSTSSFSYRAITLDRTTPTAPVLLSPANSATLPPAPFTFQWQSGIDALTATTDSLFVLDGDAQFVRQLPMISTSHTDSLGLGSYSWYVRTTDGAGNGASSLTRAFTIQ